MSNLKAFESDASIVGDIGIVLIPVVIIILGEVFRRQREQSEDAQRSADRTASLLRHHASDNPSVNVNPKATHHDGRNATRPSGLR